LTTAAIYYNLNAVALLSRSQFAEAAHVSKPAVTKAVTAGRLILTPDDKLDTYNPLNAAYLAARSSADAITPKSPPSSKPTTSSKPRPPKRDTVSPPPPIDGDDIEGMAVASMGLNSDKTKAQINLLRAQTRTHDLNLAKKKEELIPKDLQRRKWSSLDAALKTHLRDMPRRISAQITALATSGGRPAVEAALEAEISSSLARVVQAAKEQELTT